MVLDLEGIGSRDYGNAIEMVALDDLASLDATDLAEAIATGELTSEELTDHFLRRIDHLDGTLHAFVRVFHDRARREARKKDRERASHNRPLPPFHGVPIGIKDLNFVRFSKTRLGSRATSGIPSPFDDRTVGSLRRAGFVILGKTSTSELGVMPVVEPDVHPPTLNPYDLGRSAGGSSGGSCAAVAGGMLPIAHGSDGGGSVRIPSSFCGLFGHKPSRGLLRNAYGLSNDHVLYTCGAIGRSARDVRSMIEAMKPAASPSFGATEFQRRKLLVHKVTRSSLAPTDPEVVEAVDGVGEILSSLGHEVRSIDMFEGDIDDFLPLYKQVLAGLFFLKTNRLQPITAWLREGANEISRADGQRLQAVLTSAIESWLAPADLLISPTVGTPPPVVYRWRNLPPETAFRAAAGLGAYTAPFNVSGMPAASLPAGLDREGLPIGVQIVGKLGSDGLVLDALEAISMETGRLARIIRVDPAR